MRRLAVLVTGGALALGCSSSTARPTRDPSAATASALGFLRGSLVSAPGGRGRLALTDREAKRIAVYDSALTALVFVRRGSRSEAASLLEGLAAVQRHDGSLPFSFVLPKPDESIPYVRSGAVAWVGYAAAEYLDSDRSGPSRDKALALARGAATYLLARQVAKPGDPRDGLVRGGEGAYHYEFDAKGRLVERLRQEDIPWAAVEHNVDAWFFFRALARVTGESQYAEAAFRIAQGLGRLWSPTKGQLARGAAESGPDEVLSLDCASWAAVFLGAVGDRDRAETAAFVADAGYVSREKGTRARGHRMQRRGPVLEGDLLMKVFGPTLPVRDWSQLEMVWPEGSAGVALAAWRVGRVERARTILDDLEALRRKDGALPTSTIEIPFLFDTKASVAATAWAEIVRFELDRPLDKPTFWAP